MVARFRTMVMMVIIIATLAPPLLMVGTASAQETRIATIVVYGLHRIDRGQLLTDLIIAEGDRFTSTSLPTLESRAKRIPYLRFFRVQSRVGSTGMHLTFHVREARRIRMSPYARVIEDGRLVAGFRQNAEGLLGGGESWLGGLQVGARTDIRLFMDNWRPLPSDMTGLVLDLRIQDWENTFLGKEELKRWALGGITTNLPHGGRLYALAGMEGIDWVTLSGGEKVKARSTLLKGIIRQPLPLPGATLAVKGETRLPAEGGSFSRGDLRIRGQGSTGRWLFDIQGAIALADRNSPEHGLYFADSWDYLRSYESGTLPARELWFARLREEIHLFSLPLQLRRGGIREDMLIGGYLLYENALFRLNQGDQYNSAYDWGGGITARIPAKVPLRASLGIQWNEEGEPVTVFLLEEI